MSSRADGAPLGWLTRDPVFWNSPRKLQKGGHLSTITTTTRHHVTTSPRDYFTFPRPNRSTYIYRGMGLICISLSGVGLPGVNLIIYKDDLMMMAPKPVVAKEGAMKDIAECIGLFMRLSSKGLPKSVRQRQRSCLLGRDLRSLWQTDFATPRTGSRLKSPHQTATRFGEDPDTPG